MDLITIGISHHTAPIELRERLAFPRKNLPEALKALSEFTQIPETVILSTCNRVEIYAASEGKIIGVATKIKHFLSDYHHISEGEFSPYIYQHHSKGSIKHLFRVVSSLDSMVVGESQILGQVKEAYDIAKESKNTGIILNTLFQRAFNVAKIVRSTTSIGEGVISISSVAVDLAKKIFGDLQNRSVMVIGAGPMSELTLQSLIQNGTNTIIVSNRHFERAQELAAQYNGEAIQLDNAIERMAEMDIVISSTGSPGFIITKNSLKGVLKQRRNKPILLIDIAVPRDIEPEVNELDNIYLYNIDDLEKVAQENLAKRQEELTVCEEIIEKEQQEFLKWYSSLTATPTIKDLSERLQTIRIKELEKTLNQLPGLNDEQKEKIAYLTQRITNQILHTPIEEIKKRSMTGDGYFHIEVLRDLFGLNEKSSEATEEEQKSSPENISNIPKE